MATPKKTKKAESAKSASKTKAKPAAAKKTVEREKPKPLAKPRPALSRPSLVRTVETKVARDDSAKPAKPPPKPILDPEWLTKVRDALSNQRQQLLSVVQSTAAQMAEKSGDLPDVSDRASEGFEDELAVGLMAIEAAQLDDIDAALQRIDDGSYGVCEDCSKPVPRKRLEVLPFARRCLECEGLNERRGRAVEADEVEEELD